MKNLNTTVMAKEPQDCEHCLFGGVVLDRSIKGVKGVTHICRCTINPPTHASGHPIVDCKAVCTLFTERSEGHNQPLRLLATTNNIAQFMTAIKG